MCRLIAAAAGAGFAVDVRAHLCQTRLSFAAQYE